MAGDGLPLHRLGAAAIRDRVAAGSLSAEEAARFFLDRIDRYDGAVHAFLA